MAKSYFTILEVTSRATHDEIRSAYRRLAKTFHPDHYKGSAESFRQIQEAYAVLGDPVRRKAYEKDLSDIRIKRSQTCRPSSEPEPLIPEDRPVDLREISPIRSFETFSPSFDEIFDWLWRNFSNIQPSKSGRVQNLTFVVPLSREQARRGGNATIMVPARSLCPVCRGYGHIGLYECHRCAGEGAVSGELPISIAIPSGLQKDHAVIIPLERFGIRNMFFTVQFRPMDSD